MEWKFPDVGEGLHEAQVVAWHVHEGERVARDEPLVDVETDKSVVTIPAPVSGVVEKILYHEGDTVHVGEVVVVFGDGSGDASGPVTAPRSAPAPARVEAAPRIVSPEAPLSEPRQASDEREVVLATPPCDGSPGSSASTCDVWRVRENGGEYSPTTYGARLAHTARLRSRGLGRRSSRR